VPEVNAHSEPGGESAGAAHASAQYRLADRIVTSKINQARQCSFRTGCARSCFSRRLAPDIAPVE